MIEEGTREALGATAKIIEFKPKKVFSYTDISDLIPIIHRITKQYKERVAGLILKLDLLADQEVKRMAVEQEINNQIQEWQTKVEKLGAVSKGLWIADFDSGDGYFCWKFPEAKITHWHGYRDGFSGRRPVKDYLEKNFKEESLDENRIGSDQHPHSEL